MAKDLADLNARFVWTADGKVDSYRILRNPKGPLKGDCDDYDATALWEAVGKSMVRFWWVLITFQACFWHVKGERWASHVIVWRRGKGWIDNQNPEWGPLKDKLRFPVPWPVVAVKMLIGWLRAGR